MSLWNRLVCGLTKHTGRVELDSTGTGYVLDCTRCGAQPRVLVLQSVWPPR